MIGEMLGVNRMTVTRWVADAEIPPVANVTRGRIEGDDGKTYEAAKPSAATLTEREQTAIQMRSQGATLKEIAEAIGVNSPQTASNTLRRVDERLAEIPDLGEVPTFEYEEVAEPERQTASGGRFDPKIYEMLEYSHFN